MFLFGQVLLRQFKFSIKFVNLFHVMPYIWNNSTGLIDYVDSTSDKIYFKTWKLVSSLSIIHGIFFTIAYFRELLELQLDKFGDLVVATVMYLIYALGWFPLLFIRLRGKALILSCNRFLKYYMTLQGEISVYAILYSYSLDF